MSLNLRGLRILPDLAPWVAIGLIPIAGAVAVARYFKRQQWERIPTAFAITAVAFIALIAAFPTMVVDAAKSPRALVRESGAYQPDRDIRLASLDYTQESVTFYARRRVERMRSPQEAIDFLSLSRPGYLFVAAKVWDDHLAAMAGPHRIAARHYDFNRNADILVVTNDGVQP